MKNCTICKIDKPLNEFGNRKVSKDGLDYYCCACRRKYYEDRKHNYNLKEYQKNYKRVISEERKLYVKKYCEKNQYKYRIKKIKIDKGTFNSYTTKRINKLIHRTLLYKDEQKLKKSKDYLGWTKEDFLEKFGNIQENYHIDHKIPVSWFLKDTPIDLINSLDNLQLLSKEENLRKSNKFCHIVSIDFFIKIKGYIYKDYINNIIYK